MTDLNLLTILFSSTYIFSKWIKLTINFFFMKSSNLVLRSAKLVTINDFHIFILSIRPLSVMFLGNPVKNFPLHTFKHSHSQTHSHSHSHSSNILYLNRWVEVESVHSHLVHYTDNSYSNWTLSQDKRAQNFISLLNQQPRLTTFVSLWSKLNFASTKDFLKVYKMIFQRKFFFIQFVWKSDQSYHQQNTVKEIFFVIFFPWYRFYQSFSFYFGFITECAKAQTYRRI